MTEQLKQIAETLVEYCRTGQEMKGLAELYATDAVSVEAVAMPGEDSREIHGLEGIKGKHDWWNGAFEVHSSSVDGPFLHGEDKFSVIFEVDSTERQSGERSQMKEVAIYTVSGGKIAREEFYYNM